MTDEEFRAKRSASAKKAAATRAAKKGAGLIQRAQIARTRATFRHYDVRGRLARSLLSTVAYPRILAPMIRAKNTQAHTYRMDRV